MRYSRANLTCLSLSLSLSSRSTARSLLPRRLVRAQEVSQKGLQHAEEKGDRQTERETRKGKGQRRKRERQFETEREKRRRSRRRRRRRRGEEQTAIRQPCARKPQEEDADFSPPRGGQESSRPSRGSTTRTRKSTSTSEPREGSLSRNEKKEAEDRPR